MTVSSKEMACLDMNARFFGKTVDELMENAGKGVADSINQGDSCVVFCGKGNNGGDGFVAARYLFDKGYDVKVYLVGEEDEIKSRAAKKNWRKLKDLDVDLLVEDSVGFFRDYDIKSDVVVDAILGLGLKGDLREPIKTLVKTINESEKYIISVDVPTGINADTGEGNGVEADKIITFHDQKPGLPNAEVVDIGIPKKAETHVGPGELIYLKKRSKKSHKGENGKTMIIGGGKYTGAPALSALASLRSGSDLSVIHTKENIKQTIASFSPNLIVKGYNNYSSSIKELKNETKDFDVIVIGPGIGRKERDIEALIKLIREVDKKMVLDADALFAASQNIEIIENKIITPHEGEFRRLFDKKGKKENIKEMAKKHNCIIVKKGHKDLISNGKEVKVNESGSPAMTVGGTGDVLAGSIASAVANSNMVFEATAAAVFLVGKAGELAQDKKDFGVVATDIIKNIPLAKKKFYE